MLLRAFDLSDMPTFWLTAFFGAFDLSDCLTCSKTVARILKNIIEKTLFGWFIIELVMAAPASINSLWFYRRPVSISLHKFEVVHGEAREFPAEDSFQFSSDVFFFVITDKVKFSFQEDHIISNRIIFKFSIGANLSLLAWPIQKPNSFWNALYSSCFALSKPPRVTWSWRVSFSSTIAGRSCAIRLLCARKSWTLRRYSERWTTRSRSVRRQISSEILIQVSCSWNGSRTNKISRSLD